MLAGHSILFSNGGFHESPGSAGMQVACVRGSEPPNAPGLAHALLFMTGAARKDVHRLGVSKNRCETSDGLAHPCPSERATAGIESGLRSPSFNMMPSRRSVRVITESSLAVALNARGRQLGALGLLKLGRAFFMNTQRTLRYGSRGPRHPMGDAPETARTCPVWAASYSPRCVGLLAAATANRGNVELSSGSNHFRHHSPDHLSKLLHGGRVGGGSLALNHEAPTNHVV